MLCKKHVILQLDIPGNSQSFRAGAIRSRCSFVVRDVITDQPPSWPQVVAASGDKLLSIYDGTTTYALGKWTLAKQGAASRPPLFSCLYAFATPREVCRHDPSSVSL